MGFISTRDGTKIFYRDWGSGQPILFSHAWPLSSESWDAQMRFFASNGFRAIAYDRRGHGRSDQPWDGNDIDGYADDLADLAEALDLSDIALVTHSMGGGEAARYVRRHGNGRLARIAMAGAAMPLMLKSSANPDGVPIDVFDYLRSGVAERRSAFLKEVAISFYGFNRDGVEVEPVSSRVSGFGACRPARRACTIASACSQKSTTAMTWGLSTCLCSSSTAMTTRWPRSPCRRTGR